MRETKIIFAGEKDLQEGVLLVAFAMIKKISRRVSLKFFSALTLLGIGSKKTALAEEPDQGTRIDSWHLTPDRIWLGGEFWANPMEDWRVVEGWVQCQTTGANRSVHSLVYQLTDPGQPFSISVRMGFPPQNQSKDIGGGFRVGAKSELNEVKSNVFSDQGVKAGIAEGVIILGPNRKKLNVAVPDGECLLRLEGKPDGENACQLTLSAFSANGKIALGSVEAVIPRDRLVGNIALCSQLFVADKKGGGRPQETGYRFTDWRVTGKAFSKQPEQQFGPILWTMYSLSDSRSAEGFVMKLSALTGPLGKNDHQQVELLIQKEGQWTSLGESNLDQDAWVATFRIPNWNEKVATPYRTVYREKRTDGSEAIAEWSGTIKANPSGRPLRLGALTCQNDYAFPYAPVMENLRKLDPDMLYFSGDQIYESHGGFGIIRDPAEPAILNYLRKYYQFGWAFREVLRNAPTICLPDDHDVFQGNIWGEGGAPMQGFDGSASSLGGYREPAKMVNVVHKTNCAHHPDFYDSTPCLQDISVYYGDMVYGGVSFAIIGDRQWKSGPERVDTGSGRADHVLDPDFDTATLDKPGLELLGKRQEEFLKKWAEDWRGHQVKVLLSQTVFAGVATHHGGYDGYLRADLDSGSWPQSARNRAVDIIRKSKALHINGDQHLTTLTQYGVAQQRDSNWSFCTPAIAVGYPRWWRPDECGMAHQNRPKHGHAHTGEYLDGFGNKVYVYAVGNPEVGTAKNRYEKAHQKGSGFGLITIDTEKKSYHIESFRFLIDATDGNPDNQFPGWPVTLQQKENAGDNLLG